MFAKMAKLSKMGAVKRMWAKLANRGTVENVDNLAELANRDPIQMLATWRTGWRVGEHFPDSVPVWTLNFNYTLYG